jgi:hypothetical protein
VKTLTSSDKDDPAATDSHSIHYAPTLISQEKLSKILITVLQASALVVLVDSLVDYTTILEEHH